MELFVADALHGAGHDLRRLYFTRARIVYRKPCFRGEGYRRSAWFSGEAPLMIAGAFVKADDGSDARPAAAVELTLAQHDGAASAGATPGPARMDDGCRGGTASAVGPKPSTIERSPSRPRARKPFAAAGP